MSVSKVDGIGTRKDGSGGATANFESRSKFVRIALYVDRGGSNTDFFPGDPLAIELATGSGYELLINGSATSAATYLGIGNMAVSADKNRSGGSDDALTFGVLSEAVTVKAGNYEIVNVQVEGIAFVGCAAAVAAGDKLVISNTERECEKAGTGDNDASSELAIALEAAVANASQSPKQSAVAGHTCKAYLLNPLRM